MSLGRFVPGAEDDPAAACRQPLEQPVVAEEKRPLLSQEQLFRLPPGEHLLLFQPADKQIGDGVRVGFGRDWDPLKLPPQTVEPGRIDELALAKKCPERFRGWAGHDPDSSEVLGL